MKFGRETSELATKRGNPHILFIGLGKVSNAGSSCKEHGAFPRTQRVPKLSVSLLTNLRLDGNGTRF